MVAVDFLPVATVVASLLSVSQARYVIKDTYTPSNWFSKFNFFTGPDPTHGFVQYVSQSTAQSRGLIKTHSDSAHMGVDFTTKSTNGRASVRLESKATYTKGLFIADIKHMPGSICGVWPAFWTVGQNWPNNGEIDIIEGVNEARANNMALHTSPTCTVGAGSMTGRRLSNDCNAFVNGNAGCGVSNPNTLSYGTAFNQNGGGVYAMEWVSSKISIWWWPRNNINPNVLGSAPNPSTWGVPVAKFMGNCNIESKFKSHRIIFDTTFCGDWAGGVWGSSSCASKASSCSSYVANNPGAFANAYWDVKSLKFQLVVFILFEHEFIVCFNVFIISIVFQIFLVFVISVLLVIFFQLDVYDDLIKDFFFVLFFSQISNVYSETCGQNRSSADQLIVFVIEEDLDVVQIDVQSRSYYRPLE